MPRSDLWPRRLATVLGLVVAVVASGCTSWHQAYPGSLSSPADVISAHSPDDVRILHQQGVEIELHDPTVSGDSIVGEVRRFGPGRVAVPLSDIRRMDVRDGSSKTWIAVGYGGGSFGAWSGGATVTEVAHQRGANVFALHSAGRDHAVGEWLNGGGFLYRRVVAGRATQWSVGAGVTVVDFHICDDTPEEDGGPCPHRATVGLPLVVDVSRQLVGVLGGGVQAFANLNSEQSFIGLAVVLKLGDLR